MSSGGKRLRVKDVCRRPLVAMVLFSLSALAAAQGAGSWGGATGIVGAVIAILGIGYLLCGWVVWRVLKAVGVKGALRVVVTLLISCAPLAYWELESQAMHNRLDAQEQAYRDFRGQTEQFIAEKCPAERRVTAPISVSARKGVFLSDVQETSLSFAEVPPVQPLSADMKRNRDRYGTQYPNETDLDGQFNQPLQWTATKNPLEILSQGAAFVEFVEQHGPEMGQKFRVARYKWWRENATPAEFEQVLKRYETHKYLDQDNPHLTSTVAEFKAVYELTKRDVSTLEDRKHWVARGRMFLTRRSDKTLIAEYVGLAAAHNWMPIDGDRWGRVTPCPGPEVDYLDARFNWRPEQFFFKEVVRFEP